MKKSLVFLILIACVTTQAFGAYGLRPYTFTVTDEFGDLVTDSTTMLVYTAGGAAITTTGIYTDASKETLITDELATQTDGDFTFWYGESTCDIQVTNNSTGHAVKVYTLSSTDHRLMLSRNEGVLGATAYTGAISCSGTATFTGAITAGVTGTGIDIKFWGDTAGNYMMWDQSEDELVFEDAIIVLNEGSTLIFQGIDDATDWAVNCDTTDRLDLIPILTTDTAIIGVGDAAHTSDLLWYTKTAASIINIDASGDLMFFDGVDVRFNDDDVLSFSDTAEITMTFGESADDFKIDCTRTVAGNALILETTDGGVFINADGATNGDITIDARGTITTVGQVTQDGRITENHSASYTLTSPTDIGTLITVDTAAVVITLPAVAVGETYTIMNIGPDGTEIHVDVNDDDWIAGGCGLAAALDAGDKLTNTGATANKGDYVTLTYFSADGWAVTEQVGVWADGG